MTQNIYDQPDFFAGYSGLRRSREGLEGAAEWPTLRALLPPMRGLRVVDLGCGFGWFCRWASGAGAASVLGLDVSENMLARARETSPDPNVSYARADLETLSLPAAAFDLAYSSLALHYVVDLPHVIAEIHRALVPGASFVFSVEHPILTAPERQGWIPDAAGRRSWPVNGYAEEGPRVTDWLAKGVVKQHRRIATTLNLLIRTGFAVTHVEEWAPDDEALAAHPEWAEERDRPSFLLVAARRA